MKRILIIGASVLQLPAILKAKEMGLMVGVVDYDLQAVGIPYSDQYYNVSTNDEKGVCEVAEKFQADGIMTLATDMPMRSVAYTCEKLKLPGITYEAAIKATDKGEMIKAFDKEGVEHPWYYIVEKSSEIDAEILSFPCIIKPTDNSGSRGVVLVDSEDELSEAIEYSSKNGRSGSVIIEEYMTGLEVSVEVIVLEGNIHILQITDKMTTGAPYFVETGHTQPGQFTEDIFEEIRDLASRAVKAIGINSGPAHIEMMVTENGPKMIEIGARMGGDCITTHLVPLSTGIDMVKATIELSLGIKPDITPKFNKVSAIRYFTNCVGEIKGINGVEEVKSIHEVKEIVIVKNIGDVVGEITNSADRIGYVIYQCDTLSDIEMTHKKVIDKINIVTI